jgi:hypothetical protein
MNDLRHQPLDVVTACHIKNLPILQLAAQNLPQFVPFKKLHVITARANFLAFAKALGPDVALIDEDTFIPGLTLAQLRTLAEPGFPKGAGWYFQQFLKFGFAFKETGDDHYLIWDADTVPLRPMEFFDGQGRMLFTKAGEHHRPYFETYRKLLRHDPRRECSFISQHMIVRKSILREMLQTIEQNFPGPENWAWKIMRQLAGTGTNRFSEYETFGHYVKNLHPDTAGIRELPWLRGGAQLVSTRPTAADLARLAADYVFVSFEVRRGHFMGWRQWKMIYEHIRNAIR